jgi:hypothetical protein
LSDCTKSRILSTESSNRSFQRQPFHAHLASRSSFLSRASRLRNRCPAPQSPLFPRCCSDTNWLPRALLFDRQLNRSNSSRERAMLAQSSRLRITRLGGNCTRFAGFLSGVLRGKRDNVEMTARGFTQLANLPEPVWPIRGAVVALRSFRLSSRCARRPQTESKHLTRPRALSLPPTSLLTELFEDRPSRKGPLTVCESERPAAVAARTRLQSLSYLIQSHPIACRHSRREAKPARWHSASSAMLKDCRILDSGGVNARPCSTASCAFSNRSSSSSERLLITFDTIAE